MASKNIPLHLFIIATTSLHAVDTLRTINVFSAFIWPTRDFKIKVDRVSKCASPGNSCFLGVLEDDTLLLRVQLVPPNVHGQAAADAEKRKIEADIAKLLALPETPVCQAK